jgi:hypothetical protein
MNASTPYIAFDAVMLIVALFLGLRIVPGAIEQLRSTIRPRRLIAAALLHALAAAMFAIALDLRLDWPRLPAGAAVLFAAELGFMHALQGTVSFRRRRYLQMLRDGHPTDLVLVSGQAWSWFAGDPFFEDWLKPAMIAALVASHGAGFTVVSVNGPPGRERARFRQLAFSAISVGEVRRSPVPVVFAQGVVVFAGEGSASPPLAIDFRFLLPHRIGANRFRIDVIHVSREPVVL